jgi:hypothetical protein
VWAAYHGVGDGAGSLASHITGVGGPVCYQPGDGHTMTDGTLAKTGKLCSTNLYFSPDDHDGNIACGDNDQAWGPAWSAAANNGCPFDDPGGSSSLGPNNASKSNEDNALGFAGPIGVNTGASGQGVRYMRVYVR